MNREEARAYGEEWIKGIDSLCDSDKRNLDDEDEEMYEFLKAAVSALQQEPCEDAISRQAAIDAMATWDWQELYLPIHFKQLLEELPSVSTEKTGHWILLDECSNSGYYCSECHKKVVKEGWSETVKKIKFCPNCGAKMVEPQESEDSE